MVEILSGLTVGERVVAEGIQKVRPGGRVKAAEKPKAAPAPGSNTTVYRPGSIAVTRSG